MGDSIAKHYKAQYDTTAQELYQEGNKHDTWVILLELLEKPLVNPYRLGVTNLLIANIALPDLLNDSSPVDSEEYAKESLRYFYALIRLKGTHVYPQVSDLVVKAQELMDNCRAVKADKVACDEENGELDETEFVVKMEKNTDREVIEPESCDSTQRKRKRADMRDSYKADGQVGEDRMREKRRREEGA